MMGNWREKPDKDQSMKNLPNSIRNCGKKTKRLCRYCWWKNFSTLTRIKKEKPEDGLMKNLLT